MVPGKIKHFFFSETPRCDISHSHNVYNLLIFNTGQASETIYDIPHYNILLF